MLRRQKTHVETELPDRTDRNLFVRLTKSMRQEYTDYNRLVASLALKAKRRVLTPQEQEKLMVYSA